MIKAVIFDMDGTLIDTEKYYREFWPKALAEFGYHMTDEQVLSIRSLGRPFAPARFNEWYGEEFDYYKVSDIEISVIYNANDLLEFKQIFIAGTTIWHQRSTSPGSNYGWYILGNGNPDA